tara:strand:+ start:1385 stop:1744 length:360 start_codon:yes stop_codon:yes gene_type:complete
MNYEGGLKSGDAIIRLFKSESLVNKLLQLNQHRPKELEYLSWARKNCHDLRKAFHVLTGLKWPDHFTGIPLSQYIRFHVKIALDDADKGKVRNFNGNKSGLIKNKSLLKGLRSPKKLVS